MGLCLGLAVSARAVGPLNAGARRPMAPQVGRPLNITGPRAIPQSTGVLLYDPSYDLYDWEIQDDPNYQECYYNEAWGQWTGRCNISLDSPGFSITVPNRLNR